MHNGYRLCRVLGCEPQQSSEGDNFSGSQGGFRFSHTRLPTTHCASNSKRYLFSSTADVETTSWLLCSLLIPSPFICKASLSAHTFGKHYIFSSNMEPNAAQQAATIADEHAGYTVVWERVGTSPKPRVSTTCERRPSPTFRPFLERFSIFASQLALKPD